MTKKYLLKFSDVQVGEPLLARCIRATKVEINVLRADADGNILIKFPKEDETKILKFFKDKGVPTSEQKNVVIFDREKCVDCGACISLCPTKAYTFDTNKKLIYDDEKCVLCKICIDACPRRALSAPKY